MNDHSGARPPSLLSPQAVAAAFRPHLSVTSALIAVNLGVFLAMTLSGASPLQPSSEQLIRWGANYGPYSLDRQWWRMLTAVFVHIGLVHLLLNMWCLWELGSLAELLYGPRDFLGVYLLGGWGGSIASLAHKPMVLGAGASGAIFAIVGAVIASLYLGKVPVPPRTLRISLITLLAFASYNLAYGFLKSGIDNGAHVGGLVCGLLLGVGLSGDFARGPQPAPAWRRALFPAMAILLLTAALGVRQVNRQVALLGKAEQELQQGKAPAAIADLSRSVQLRPSYAAYLLLGNAYAQAKQDAPAEMAYQRALQLQPSDTAARSRLGVLYWKTQRLEPARATFAKITELDPKDADAWYSLGLVLRQMGHEPEAAAALQKATALKPASAAAQFNLGLTLMTLKRYDEAVAAFQAVVRLAPNDPEAYIWLGNAYEAKGMGREADAAFLKGYSLKAQRTRRK
jgi:membrane associated rhomboid family serine protease/Flp pilus assembly protein TadD